MLAITTQTVIEEMTNAFLGADATNRQKFLFEQSLLNLVRLAKAEQKTEIKASVKKLTVFTLENLDACDSNALPKD